MTHRLCMLSFFHGGYTSLFSQKRCTGIPGFHSGIFPAVVYWNSRVPFGYFQFFNFSHFFVGILVPYCDFNLHFLMSSDAQCSFAY